ncbi:GntR family transcriptional regulator [Armatimonas sp.]|uniref:GntR family transcriptional regulator n=1 Tax=Armatimonas sp. TaxID=1872638 RepID=UPI00374D9FA3
METFPPKDTVPLYVKIYQELRAELESNQLPPQSRIPTERELSERFATTRITVAKALSLLTQEGFLERRPGAGTFVQEWRQERLAEPPSPIDQVAVLSGYTKNRDTALIVSGIAEAFGDDGSGRFALYDSRDELAQEAECLRRIHAQVLQGKIRGLIALPVGQNENRDAYVALEAAGCKLVFVDRYLTGIPADRVTSDNEGGTAQAIAELVALGHTRIAFLCSYRLPNAVIRDRQAGYERALSDAGLTVRPEWIRRAEWARRIGYVLPTCPLDDCEAIFKEWLQDPEPPTAIFCANDRALQSGLLTLRQRGVRVGPGIALAGFLNRSDWVEHVQEPFLGIRQWQSELGKQAAQLLHERLTATDTPAPNRSISIGVDFVYHPSADAWRNP